MGTQTSAGWWVHGGINRIQPCVLITESRQPRHGLYADAPGDVSPGQHALLRQAAPGRLHPGKLAAPGGHRAPAELEFELTGTEVFP